MRINWHGRYAETTDAVVVRMVGLYRDGKTIREIASEVGVVHSTVSKVLRRAGIEKRQSVKRKKLSVEKRRELADRYAAGEIMEALQKSYGVSSTVVTSCLDEFGVKHRTGWSGFGTEEWTDRRGRVFVFKSTWELAYAQHLDAKQLTWEYEPCKFPLVECKCYTPDFAVYESGSVEYHEVKGWLDQKTIRRISEFRRTYPRERFKMVGPLELAELGLVDEKYRNHKMGDLVFRFQQITG